MRESSMKKEIETEMEDELLPEYDFAQMGESVRGKYAQQYKEGTNLLRLDADVAAAFPNDEAVNE